MKLDPQHDHEHNAAIQDALHRYRDETVTDEDEGLAFDMVIEALQETCSRRGEDIDAATIVVTTDALGHPQSYDVYGSGLDGKSMWTHIITRSRVRFVHRVAL